MDQTHLYDAIETDHTGREDFLLCGLNVYGIEGRFGVDRRFGFEEPGVDRLDTFSPRFVGIDGDNPIV